MHIAHPLNIPLAYEILNKDDKTQFIWAHGWGQSHSSFLSLANSIKSLGSHILLDLPGFGKSPAPPTTWGSKDYAAHIAVFLNEHPAKRRIFIGHSFGCKVGIELATNYPKLIDQLILIAAPGIAVKKPLIKTIKLKTKIYTYKTLKKLIPLGLNDSWLKNKFGSTDYRNAGNMRHILVKIINEDLSNNAKKINCPTHLIYGDKDIDTPPAIGQAYQNLIKDARLYLLPNFDHHTILTDGHHQILHLLKKTLN